MRSLPLAWPVAFALALVVVLPTCTCPRPASEPLPPPPPSQPPPPPSETVPSEPAPTEPAPAEPGATDARQPLVPASHPLYARVEGTQVDNACSSDADCHVGGCSREVCSADPGVITTCEKRLFPSQGGSCGCVQSQCTWYGDGSADGGSGPASPGSGPASPGSGAADGNTGPASGGDGARSPRRPKPTRGGDGSALPGTGKPCTADGRCAEGLTCLSYYGVAGPAGPKFTSCERHCTKGKTCPDGQRCITIADGPGQVCR